MGRHSKLNPVAHNEVSHFRTLTPHGRHDHNLRGQDAARIYAYLFIGLPE